MTIYFTEESFSYVPQNRDGRSLRLGFTRRLMADLLTVPEFADTTFAFTDINQHNLDMVKQLAERDIAGNDLPDKIVATTDRRAAIADSDYVICMIRQDHTISDLRFWILDWAGATFSI